MLWLGDLTSRISFPLPPFQVFVCQLAADRMNEVNEKKKKKKQKKERGKEKGRERRERVRVHEREKQKRAPRYFKDYHLISSTGSNDTKNRTRSI